MKTLNNSDYIQISQELLQKNEILKVCCLLNENQIPFLILKGTHYAYSYYSYPHHRPRLDTDLFVSPKNFDRTCQLFLSSGYSESPQLQIFNERLFSKCDNHGSFHHFDLHKNLSNRSYFSELFQFEELYQRKQPIPLLGSHIFGLGAIDSLIYTFIHNLAHHCNEDDLSFLKDLELIWKSLPEEKQNECFVLAQKLQLYQSLKTKLQKSLNLNFSENNVIKDSFVVRRFSNNLSWFEMIFWDFIFLPTWSQRFKFVKEFLWPEAYYFQLSKNYPFFFLRIHRLLKTLFLKTFFFISILLIPITGYTKEQTYKTYRIIRTSPVEFVSALRIAPTNQMAKKTSNTRMSRFFRVKSKKVSLKKIDLEVIPDIPLFQDYFPDITLLKIHLEEIKSDGRSFDFQVSFLVRDNQQIQAFMKVQPHKLGSLMSLSFNQSHYPEWVLKAFFSAASNLGFLAQSEEEAVKNSESTSKSRKSDLEVD